MAPSPVTSAPAPFEWPPLVSFYVPSPSTDDDDADADDDDIDLEDFDTSFPADDFLDDSHDDWSDDRPDSSDDSDCSFDSDDCSAAWTTKSKRHPPHPRVHKKSSYHSACDYLSVFGALRKGFCSRPSDQRIEIPKPHGRADMSTLPKTDDSVQLEKKSVVLENRDSAGVILKDRKGASCFTAMFKCTAADTPKLLFSRAYASEDSNEEVIESENGPDARMVLDCNGEGSLKKPQSKETVGNTGAQKKYEEARAESGSGDSQVSSKSSLISSKSRKSDENLILKEVDKSRKSRKASGKRSCPRESNREGSHNKDDSKLSTTGCSNKSLKHPNQAALTVNTLKSQYKDCDSLENTARPPSMDLKEESSSVSDNLDEAVDVQTLVEKDVTDPEVPTIKSKLQDIPLQIYMKEKHQPEVVVKDSKRKAKAKKVKASKGKKQQLLRDGFTPPAETEPAEDADSAPSVVEKQFESNDKVQSPKIVVNNQILKQVVPTSAIEDDTQPPIVGEMENGVFLPGSASGNGTEVVDGVPLRDSTVPVATSKVIKSQPGNPVSNDTDHAGLVLPDTPSKGSSFSSASYQNVEDGDGSDFSSIEALHDSQPHPEAQISGISEKNLLRNGFTSALPPTEVSSRRWSSRSAVARHDQADLETSINGSLSVPDLLVGDSLAAAMLNSSTSLSHDPALESESFENIQGNSDCSLSPNSPFIEAPSAAYCLGKRVVSRAIGSSTPRTSTTGTSDIQFNQMPVSQNLAYAPNSVPTTTLQQELIPPALFHVDSRASVASTWIQPGTSSGPGFSFPLAPVGTACIGQVIGCNNQTLSMYKQMKSFSIEARYLVDAPSIVPGCCKLFLFNIESRQLHGVYVSSSLQAMPIDHECPVAFDCIENYSHPLSVGELDGVLPEAKNMDGRPLFLQPHTVEQLATLLQRKNKPRLSWVSSISNPISVSGVHGLLEFSTIASEIPYKSHDHLAEEVGQGSFGISAANEVARDPWSSLSSGYSGKVSEYGPERIASEPDSQLGTARIFPFPASSIINVEGAQSVRPEISQTGHSRKLPIQGVAPSPMALWPHLFPKASSADTKKESFMYMETREGSSTQKFHASLSEMIDMGARPDTESEAVSFSPLSECGLRSTAHRPKSVYNPLAVEQGRQRHLFDSSKPWSPLASELDLQQYGSRLRSQDKIFNAPLSSPSSSEQSMMSNISGGVPVQLSAAASSQLPLHYQVDHALPDSLKDDLGLSRTGTRQSTSAWNEDLHLQHLPTTQASVAGAVDLDQTNMCCYCFTRRADHLIIDCQHLGPCVECAASKKIEYCGHCQTKVTRLLRLFRPV